MKAGISIAQIGHAKQYCAFEASVSTRILRLASAERLATVVILVPQTNYQDWEGVFVKQKETAGQRVSGSSARQVGSAITSVRALLD